MPNVGGTLGRHLALADASMPSLDPIQTQTGSQRSKYSLGIARLLQGAGGTADLVVAGARFANFPRRVRLTLGAE